MTVDPVKKWLGSRISWVWITGHGGWEGRSGRRRRSHRGDKIEATQIVVTIGALQSTRNPFYLISGLGN